MAFPLFAIGEQWEIFALAVGFGAQSLVKDILSGFFILLEDQIRVDELNIEMPFPHVTLYMEQNKQAGSKPLHVYVEKEKQEWTFTLYRRPYFFHLQGIDLPFFSQAACDARPGSSRAQGTQLLSRRPVSPCWYQNRPASSCCCGKKGAPQGQAPQG